MTNERYFERKDDEGAYYIFDKNTITEAEFDEKHEYEGYTAFEDSMQGTEVVYRLNEYEQLLQESKNLIAEGVDLSRQRASIINELKMLDNTDNWTYDRLKYTIRKIAEITGYKGGI